MPSVSINGCRPPRTRSSDTCSPAPRSSATRSCRARPSSGARCSKIPTGWTTSLRYLPSNFRFRGSLFLVAGYDIGVALAPHASLNAGHRHFAHDPRELLYYAIHELHHFMTYSPPPPIADRKTCGDLAMLVDYSTALEGTAVLAAFDLRRRENALGHDGDYVALGDEQRMCEYEARYAEDLDYLRRRGEDPVDDEALAVIDRMSGGERLWYRIGARMAMRIEQAKGREKLVALVTAGDLRRAPRGRSAV